MMLIKREFSQIRAQSTATMISSCLRSAINCSRILLTGTPEKCSHLQQCAAGSITRALSATPSQEQAQSSQQSDPQDSHNSAEASSAQASIAENNESTDQQTSTSFSNKPDSGRMRSLKDIFQMEAAAEAAAQETIGALQADIQPGQEATDSLAGSEDSQQHRPARPGDRLVSQQYGYAALGGRLPKQSEQFTIDTAGAQPRIHPTRLFRPGETYNPEDLNPFIPSTITGRQQRGRQAPATAQEVRQLADYKNVGFLEQFLTPAGKLIPRRISQLPSGVHQKLMREIKRARHMGLIAGEARPEKRNLRRLRELTSPVQHQAELVSQTSA